MIELKDRDKITRRQFAAGAGLAAAAGPFVWTRRAGAAGKVIIRTIGGSYEEATVKAILEPFTKATGIEVVKVPATLGKVLAMHEAGNMELDVMDAGELGVFSLSQKGALDKINYKAWKLTNPDDIDPAVRRDDMVADILFLSVLGYNNQTFPTGKQPRSWAEFWDLKKFAGPRMLAESPRARSTSSSRCWPTAWPRTSSTRSTSTVPSRRSIGRVRPSIRESGTRAPPPPRMLADKEVVLGSYLERAAPGGGRQGRPARHRVERGHAPDAVLGPPQGRHQERRERPGASSTFRLGQPRKTRGRPLSRRPIPYGAQAIRLRRSKEPITRVQTRGRGSHRARRTGKEGRSSRTGKSGWGRTTRKNDHEVKRALVQAASGCSTEKEHRRRRREVRPPRADQDPSGRWSRCAMSPSPWPPGSFFTPARSQRLRQDHDAQ